METEVVYVDIHIYDYSLHNGSTERLNVCLNVGEKALLKR